MSEFEIRRGPVAVNLPPVLGLEPMRIDALEDIEVNFVINGPIHLKRGECLEVEPTEFGWRALVDCQRRAAEKEHGK